jgi:hypothetical protein
VDHAISILGQTILILTGLAIVCLLVFLIIGTISAIIRMLRKMRELPPASMPLAPSANGQVAEPEREIFG